MLKTAITFNAVEMYQAVDGGCMLCFKLDKQQGKAIQNAVSTAVDGLKAGKKYYLTVSEQAKKRTLDANAYFHVLVEKIAQVLNVSAEEVKSDLLTSYGTAVYVAKIPKTADIGRFCKYAKFLGETDDGQKEYMLYKPSHEMNTKEMGRLIDGAIAEARDLGIATETPRQIAMMKREEL